MSRRILVIKTGHTHDAIRARFGCFEDWIAAGLGVARDDIDVVDVFRGETLPTRRSDEGDNAYVNKHAGIVITGSPAMVTDRHPWSENLAAWLAERIRTTRVPVLGICYGHQLLAHALGGRVADNPRGREIGSVKIRLQAAHADDPLFSGSDVDFVAHVTHLQSVVELPPGAVHLAGSALEPHHAFRVGDNVWGVQFHPEFDEEIMTAYVDALGERMRNEGLDPATIRAAIAPAPAAARILRRFAALTQGA